MFVFFQNTYPLLAGVIPRVGQGAGPGVFSLIKYIA